MSVSISLLDIFKSIPDHRRKQGQLYKLEYLLLFSILAMLCGATTYVDIALWIKERLETLKQIFNLKWKKSPSKSGI